MASISKSAMALAAFTALGTLTGCGVSGQQLSTDAMLVDFNGGSGSFKVYTMLNQSSGHKSKTFWNINYKSLYELDAGGNKIQGRGVSTRGQLRAVATWNSNLVRAGSDQPPAVTDPTHTCNRPWCLWHRSSDYHAC